MNKKLYTLCAIAAAFVLAGCQKETNNEPAYVGPTHTLTFTAEKMLDSKTAIASEENGLVSYKWIAGDEDRMHITESFSDGETTVNNKGTISEMILTNSDKTARFSVTFAGEAPTGEVTYNAVYAGHVSSNGNLQIPAEQSPLQDSFDPNADALIADAISLSSGRDQDPSFMFNLTRKVSVNKMILKGLTPGETISKVIFESDKNHSAFYKVSTNEYVGTFGKKLTFNYSANNAASSDGEFPVYFTTAPVENATFTVSVTTNQHKYRKTSTKTISFATGEVRRFGVNLSGCEVPDGRAFTLVEDVDDLVIGSDVVIATNGSNDIAMSTTQNNNNRGETDATKNSDYSKIEVTDQVQIFTLANGTISGTYAFLCKNGDQEGKYIYAASSSGNQLKSQVTLDANASWTISISSKEATITAQGSNTRNVLQYNAGSKIFACYASASQQNVYLYQAAGLPAANLSFTDASYTFTLGDSDYTSFAGQTLNNPNNISDIIWTSSNESLATVSDGVITWIPDATGTATITATFEGDDFFGAGNASYTITVNAPTQSTSLPFIETFANCTGEAGWSGGAGAGTFVPDHEDWFVSSAHGANGAAKFGTGSVLGSAETPQIEYSGNATLTFKAGAWNGNSESTNLKLSVSSGALYGDASLTIPISSVTLVKGDWTTYTVYLKNLESPFTVTFEGNASSNSRFFLDDVSIVEGIVQPAASFGASMSNTDNVLAAGGTKTINVTGNVAWTASATNGASVSPSSGTGIGTVTVSVPENETSSEKTYTVTISTSADVDPDSYAFSITQDAASSVVNESTEADPYTADEAYDLVGELSGGSLDDVYVYGIISGITTAYNSTYGNVSFDISIDGSSSGSKQLRIFRAPANSATDFEIGDAVELKGTLTLYNTTRELEADECISSVKKPTISPNGGGFTNSQSVTIACATTGATIRYTTNGSAPTSSSTVYGGSITLTTTATVKAIAIKGILTTAVASAEFTKGSNSATLEITSGTFTGSTSSLSMTTSGITITQLKDDGTNCNTTYNTVSTLRVYRANQMKFTGKTFTKIEMYYTGTYSGADWSVVSGGGSVSIDTTNKKVVWTNASGASTVALKNSTASGTNTQLRTTKFVVVYNN